MRNVYSQARVTVAWDRLLEGRSARPRTRVLAIAACDWVARVWTLEEAILSLNLVFVFNGVFLASKDILLSLIYETVDNSEKCWTRWGAIRMMYSLNNQYLNHGDAETILQTIVPLSRERLTTKPIDMVRAIYPASIWTSRGPTPHKNRHKSSCCNISASQHRGWHRFFFGPLGLSSPWSWASILRSRLQWTLDFDRKGRDRFRPHRRLEPARSQGSRPRRCGRLLRRPQRQQIQQLHLVARGVARNAPDWLHRQ